jgi:mannose-6-phosphate isomerase-like protein (cupin superfamily)
MKKYQRMPDQLVVCWVDEDVGEEPGKVDFHYHSVEEWLQILKGEMTFFSAGNRHKYPLGEGQALNIPQGEVHRVEIGSSGVTYRMWTPLETEDQNRRLQNVPSWIGDSKKTASNEQNGKTCF